MAKWVTFDTRQMDQIRGLVDGFVHVLPQRQLGLHWVDVSCWCDPVVWWSGDLATMCVGHHRKKYPHDSEADRSALHPKSR